MSHSRDPAPGELETVRQFLNTIDFEDGTDEFADPPALEAWLGARSLLPEGETLGDADLRRAIEVREALRALLRANAGADPDREAIALLNRAARNARLVVRLEDGGEARLTPDARGIEAPIGRLLATVYTAVARGTWPRLKVCLNDECRWAFYDHSKNRSGRWCTMDVCGNVMKARAYRARRASREAQA
jgi:predicted RNA-binding Zn ribbon-like protein